jgi:hypothetical protein
MRVRLSDRDMTIANQRRELGKLYASRDALKAELAEAKARHDDTVACCHKLDARLRVAEEALDEIASISKGERLETVYEFLKRTGRLGGTKGSK